MKKDELQEALTALGIEFPADAKKDDLQKLYDEAMNSADDEAPVEEPVEEPEGVDALEDYIPDDMPEDDEESDELLPNEVAMKATVGFTQPLLGKKELKATKNEKFKCDRQLAEHLKSCRVAVEI